MTDIAERLRTWADIYRHGARPGGDLMAEAAAEIERLRAALDDECTAHQVCVEMRDNANAEIERLHGEIEQYRERLGLP